MLSAVDVTMGGLTSIPVLVVIALIADKTVQGQSKEAEDSTEDNAKEQESTSTTSKPSAKAVKS